MKQDQKEFLENKSNPVCLVCEGSGIKEVLAECEKIIKCSCIDLVDYSKAQFKVIKQIADLENHKKTFKINRKNPDPKLTDEMDKLRKRDGNLREVIRNLCKELGEHRHGWMV